MPETPSMYTTEAICLKAFDYGEADKILSFYSPERGEIRAIAKGAKRPKSKLAGACEVLNLSEIQFTRGRNLDVVSQYQSKEPFPRIRGHLLKLAYAILFAELVEYLATAEDSDSHQIFVLLKGTLRTLEALGVPDVDSVSERTRIVALATDFQLQLLNAAGYQPSLELCVTCGEPLTWDLPYYYLSAEQGGVLCPECRHDFPTVTLVAVSTPTLRVLNDPEGDAWEVASPVKVQKFLRYYFSHKVEREIRSYDFVFELLDAAP